MVSTDAWVRKEVVDEINRSLAPGQPVTKEFWMAAYQRVRSRAIKDTERWKQVMSGKSF